MAYRRIVFLCILIFVGSFLLGCARNLTQIQPGLSRETVIERLGKPNFVSRNEKEGLRWIYTNRDLESPPYFKQQTEDGEILLLDLAEANPSKRGFSEPGSYRMLLTLTFGQDGTVKGFQVGAHERIGPIHFR